MAIKKANTGGSSPFFKPSDFQHKFEALLIEVHGIRRAVPGKYGARDMADVTVSAFKGTKDNSPVTGKYTIDKNWMVKALDGLEGDATIVKVGQSEPKDGRQPAWIFEDADDKVYDHIVDWSEKREAELDDAPSFND